MERILWDIASLAGCTPTSAGDSTEWKQIITNAEDTRRKLRQVPQGETTTVYSALHGVYAEVDLKMVWNKAFRKCNQAKYLLHRKNSVNREDVSGIPPMTNLKKAKKSSYAHRWSYRPSAWSSDAKFLRATEDTSGGSRERSWWGQNRPQVKWTATGSKQQEW